MLEFSGMGKETFTTNEAAAELNITPARVRQMVLDGTLPAEKFGRDLVITAEALEIARQRKTVPGPEPKKKSVMPVKKRSRKK
jgi:excisionase family DNA binding protein